VLATNVHPQHSPRPQPVLGSRVRGALGPMDAFHQHLHLDPRGDPRTPSVNPETGAVSWQLRPDYILAGCVARGCRVKLYQLANGSIVPEIEP
jgi:hypothetical protein